MLGRDELILETIGFLVGDVDDPPHARCDEHLRLLPAAAVDIHPRRCTQQVVRLHCHRSSIDAELLQNLTDHALGLFKQREQNVLGVDLRVAIALEHPHGALRCFLCALGESIESHHSLVAAR